MCMAISAHFLRTSAEKREVRSQRPAPLPVPFVSGRKRARHAAHTSLAHSIPWTRCANTHYPSDPSWAKRPPPQIGFSHKLWRKPTPAITRHPSAKQALGPRPLIQIFHTHFRALSSATIGSLRCSSQSANLVLFLPWLPSFPRGLQLFGPPAASSPHSPAHFFAGIVHLSPIFSFDASVQRLTEKVPVESTRRGPHLSFSMWSTSMCVFHVPTSSAQSVNSSGLSLTVTSGQPSDPFGLRTLKFPMPLLRYPTSRARWLS